MELKRGWGATLWRLFLTIYTSAPPFRSLEQHLPKIAKKASDSILISPHWAVASLEEKLGKTSRLASLDMELKEYLIKNLPPLNAPSSQDGYYRVKVSQLPYAMLYFYESEIGASSLRRAPWQLLHVSSMIETELCLEQCVSRRQMRLTHSTGWQMVNKLNKTPINSEKIQQKTVSLMGRIKVEHWSELPCEIIISSPSQAPRAH